MYNSANRFGELSCKIPWRILRIGALLVLPLLSVPAIAGFQGYYAPGNFTLINNNADGSIALADGGLTMVLTGGNNGSGMYGTTDLTIVVPLSGAIQFSYLFTTLDIDPQSGDVFDTAGYLLGDLFVPFSPLLSDNPVPINIPVSSGQSFGFRIETLDNTGEPGVLTISSFEGPQSVPEPRFGLLLPLLAGAWAAWRLLRGRPDRTRPVEEEI